MRTCRGACRHPEVLHELHMDARTLIAQQISACPPLQLSVHLQNPLASRPVKLRVRRRALAASESSEGQAGAAPAAPDAAEGAQQQSSEAGGEQGQGQGNGGGAAAEGGCSSEALQIAAILDHLTHTCCWETAAKLSAALLERAAAARSVAGVDGADMPRRPVWEAMAAALVKEEAHAEIRLRKRALELVVEGKVAEVRSPDGP